MAAEWILHYTEAPARRFEGVSLACYTRRLGGPFMSLSNICPVDLRPLPPVPVSTEADVKRTLAAARAAQPAWGTLGLPERARLLKRAARRMLERRQEVLELLHDEAGKTPAEILMSEALGPLQYVSDWVRVARAYTRPRKLPINPVAFPGKRGVIEILPRGVVGIIAPWNYPLAVFFKPLFAALLTGNAVVIKPSEYAPRTAAWLVAALNEFLPTGVLGCVQGDRVVGRLLIRSGIDALTFTGSFQSGQEVVRLAAEQMIPCSCELGGKDAAIVLADCDLNRTIAGIMHWRFHNAGQACGAVERVFVESNVADAFVRRMGAAVSRLRVSSGDPQSSDVGPMVHPAQLAIVEDHVADALAQGARLVCGGHRTGKGLWFEPTVLDGCTAAMKVMTEPTFGPVLPICRVADAEEAVQRANACEYGLNASVWGGDLPRAEALARRLEAGTVFVNNHALTGAMAAAPWTGVKHSGYGIANSAFALGHYTRPRTILVDRSRVPDPFWFPVNASLEELGHRLADAQLGRVLSAWKLPLLIRSRQREVAALVKNGAAAAAVSRIHPGEEHSSVPLAGLRKAARRWLPKLTLPPLTERELAWGRATFEAVYAAPADARLPDALTGEEWDAFLKDILGSAPLLSSVGLRAGLWVAGLAPLVAKRTWRTMDRLSLHEREQVIEAMSHSDVYFIRQVAVLLKTTGGLAHASTTRMQEAARRPLRSASLRAVGET
jgi:acyl-CoA reductase-like NAD-dependent aldehyde dehydrogenase